MLVYRPQHFRFFYPLDTKHIIVFSTIGSAEKPTTGSLKTVLSRNYILADVVKICETQSVQAGLVKSRTEHNVVLIGESCGLLCSDVTTDDYDRLDSDCNVQETQTDMILLIHILETTILNVNNVQVQE